MKEILTVHVKLEDQVFVQGTVRAVNLIHFSGYADGPYFQGKVLPHGIDCQCSENGAPFRLSARYVLEGKDCRGNACRIAIENNGVPDENGNLYTKPVLTTDSQALSWMETAELTGTLSDEGGELLIHIRAFSV